MSVSQCAACGAIVPQYDTAHTASEGHGDRLLCTACFNREMAHHVGLDDFGVVTFKPVHLTDANGIVHEFHFRSLLFGDKLSLEAFDAASEEESSGYRCQILGDPLSDQFVLLGKLIEKMSRLLAVVVSGKPAALYPASVCVGTISSMFNRMEIGHGGDGRKTIA